MLHTRYVFVYRDTCILVINFAPPKVKSWLRHCLGPFGLRPRFVTRPKTCDYRPGRSKAALFEPRPKIRSYSLGKNAASDRPGLSTIWP